MRMIIRVRPRHIRTNTTSSKARSPEQPYLKHFLPTMVSKAYSPQVPTSVRIHQAIAVLFFDLRSNDQSLLPAHYTSNRLVAQGTFPKVASISEELLWLILTNSSLTFSLRCVWAHDSNILRVTGQPIMVDTIKHA